MDSGTSEKDEPNSRRGSCSVMRATAVLTCWKWVTAGSRYWRIA
ncbi:hypothetical protein [Amycolatopsis sp. DG1A-15b]|nr:hypothetical protein [Amycolatopsis sp. DG1A-15b]WIX88015.1 hypothetical protein QRY02_43955 [Amycolatopsis sp. DG1A-15b]